MIDWIEKYFEYDVGFKLDKIMNESGGYGNEKLETALRNFISLSSANNHVCILPFLETDKTVSLLISTLEPEQSSELRTFCEAYMGSVYGLVDKKLFYNPINKAHKLVLENYPGGIIRVHIPKSTRDNNYREKVYKAFGLLNELLQRYTTRPFIASTIKRPVGRVLRDLFTALRNSHRDSLWTYFDELESSNSLSVRNLHFLRIQILSHLGETTEITNYPSIATIVNARLPSKVSSALLAALQKNNLNIAAIELSQIEEIKERNFPFSGLFLREPDLTEKIDDDLWLPWCIGAALFGNYKGITKARSKISESDFLRIAEIFDFQPAVAVDIQQSNNLDDLLNEQFSKDNLLNLLKASLTANDAENRNIINKLNSFDAELVEKCIEGKKPLIDLYTNLIEDQPSDQAINGWNEWFESVLKSPDSEALLQLALDNSVHWKLDSWDEKHLSELIDDSSNNNASTLRNVLPNLLEWLENNDLTLKLTTLESMALYLATDDYSSVEDLSLIQELLESLLKQAHNSIQYDDMLDAISTIWNKVSSTVSIKGIFEVFDVLIEYPCADTSRRLILWREVEELLHQHWHRLDIDYKIFAKQLSEELVGSSEHLYIETHEHDTLRNVVDLSGKKLAIYTLMKGAAQRAKDALENIFPGLKIYLNHDHESTNQLVNLSRTADYFIFASRAAKHQAFYPVTKNRDDIIYPDGKGSASIVRAFRSLIEGT